jgi:hypothetical protein
MLIYAIKIQDVEISSILNFVKLLCAPTSKTEIHLSVRGPYKSPLKSEKLSKYNKIIKNSEISIIDFANFFSENQNTVFLKCEGEELKKVWKKTTYLHEYNPHLTLYDGRNKEFANTLYQILRKRNINIEFTSSELIAYDTSKKNTSLILSLGINNDIIEEVLGIAWDKLDVNLMDSKSRFKLIDDCFKYLETKSIRA